MRRRTRYHPDQLELSLVLGRGTPTPMSRATTRRRSSRTPTPAPKPWQCVVLAVDTARTSGWAVYDRGAVGRYGEVDTLTAGACYVIVQLAVARGIESALPVVLVLEAPFGGAVDVVAALGAARERWLQAWRHADQAMRRVVLVLPSVWRGPVLGSHAVAMRRDDVRELEVRTATGIARAVNPAMGFAMCGHDEAAAILIGRWASHAAAVGRVIGKRATRASLNAWMQRHG